MDKASPNLIPSGIEPVDELRGGLDSGQLYLVHGEAAGKSLFGIKFLIEGLRRGENCALVIRYSPEDAVRRFARLGYDPLEDVYSGRLVILEYSDDIIHQISRLKELTPVLRELEWLLGETRPHRLIFDPVAALVLGESGNTAPRAKEFADWASSFGATVVMIANGEGDEIVESFRPIVSEVFRFELRETVDRATRFLAFEKSSAIADQAIEVDPSRGIFLLARPPAKASAQAASAESPAASAQPFHSNASARNDKPDFSEQTTELEAVNEGPLVELDLSDLLEPLADLPLPEPTAVEPVKALTEFEWIEPEPEQPAVELQTTSAPQAESLAQSPANRSLNTTPLPALPTRAEAASAETESAAIENSSAASEEESPTMEAAQQDDLSRLIEELAEMSSPLDLEIPELEMLDAQERETVASAQPEPVEQPAIEQTTATAQTDDASVVAAVRESSIHDASSPEASINESVIDEDRREASQPVASLSQKTEPEPTAASESETSRRHARAADAKIDSAIAARAVELLLRPPESHAEAFSLPLAAIPVAPIKAPTARPKDFNVLVIDDDPASCEQIAQALEEYSVETVHDGVSGLAKLISFKPDLVVLDVDLPIVDGFKVLAHIRSSLNMPVIVLSGTRVRAGDRVMSAELGADYFLTKPFSVKELQQKARQLIARYRGINSWIITSPHAANEQPATERRSAPQQQTARVIEPIIMSIETGSDQFTPYDEFTSEVERKVHSAIDNNTPFSIVGCRLPNMTSNGGRAALRLFEIVSTLARDTDSISTNPRNDLVVLLVDADASGARAFISRLRERVIVEMNVEPSVWLRSFPELEESKDALPAAPTNGHNHNRRASDIPGEVQRVEFKPAPEIHFNESSELAAQAAVERAIAKKLDPRESYIDFLEQL